LFFLFFIYIQMKKFMIGFGVCLIGLCTVSAQDSAPLPPEIAIDEISVEAVPMDAVMPGVEEVMPATVEIVEVEEAAPLNMEDRGNVPEIELYDMESDAEPMLYEEPVAEPADEEGVLFRFSDGEAPLVEDGVPTTLAAPKCEAGEGFLNRIKHFFKSLFGQCEDEETELE
jgi:hypothetical protein